MEKVSHTTYRSINYDCFHVFAFILVFFVLFLILFYFCFLFQVVVLNDFNLEEDGMFPFFPFFLSFFFFLSFLLDFPVAFIPKLLLRYG